MYVSTNHIGSKLSSIAPVPHLQERKTLEDVLKNPMPEPLQAFCKALLSNQIGGPDSSLSLSQRLPSGRRALLELLVHQDAVLLSGSPLLAPLHLMAFRPPSAAVRTRRSG